MSKLEKPAKGFVIKLSSETAQKLAEEIPVAVNPKPEASVASASQKTAPEIDVAKPIETTNQDPEVTFEDKKSDDKPNEGDSSSWGHYSPYITFEGDLPIYTDPSNQKRYTWDKDQNVWNPESGDDSVPGRVYSYEDDKHIYTEADGSKFFYDVDKKAWIPQVDDDFLARYQMSYGFVDNSQKEEDKVDPKAKIDKKPEPTGVKRKTEPQWFEPTEDNNTKVYVSNLPLDLTEEEFVNFMQKCGLVMKDMASQKMKVKLYYDKDQNCFKGDALCTYIKKESVELALNLLDGSDLKGNKVKVELAHFQMKGDYNPALKPKKKKKKELEKMKRMQEKLFDWRPEKIAGEKMKHEKVVIIKNLFHPTDFDKDVQLILDYQQDLREECSKCGEVRKVAIFDRHPEGVAQVNMKEPEEATAVVALINGRWFGKKQITAEIWDGRTKYRIAETDADIGKRIEKWDKFLEGDNKATEEGTGSQNTSTEPGSSGETTKPDEINSQKEPEIPKDIESKVESD